MRVRSSGIGAVLWIVLGGMLIGACANPEAPSGGPKDNTPPSIVKARPVPDTVNVRSDTRSVYVEFSEYVERSTLPRALSITPRFEGRIQYDWSGRGVEIELPSTLRDSTTYIFSFDTNLSDAHGVSLQRPITIAFATGPRINQGELKGRVVSPQRAESRAGVDVFAYDMSERNAPPSPLPKNPDYRTQTGEDGTFAFDYLREQDYYVIALRDNNRNRQPDPTEPFAVPPQPVLKADSGGTNLPVPWLLTTADTLRPRLQQAQSRSRERVRLNFSEPILLSTHEPSAWSLRDSVANAPVSVRGVYQPSDRSNTIVLRTAPMDAVRHTLPLTSDLATDTLGHELRPDTARIQPSMREDTTQTRFQTFVPQEPSPDSIEAVPLLPTVQPGVRFNQVPDSSTLQSTLALRDTAGQERRYTLTTQDGRTYRFVPDPPLQPDAVLEVTVDRGVLAGPDTTYRRQFRRVTTEELGALEGRVVRTDTTHPAVRTSASGAVDPTTDTTQDNSSSLVVELTPVESTIPLDPRTQTVPPESTFVFKEVPEGRFRFRAFLDRNANGHWDGGQITPFQPAEPITWSKSPTASRLRWTTVLPAPLRLPLLRAEQTRPSDSAAVDSIGNDR